MKAMKKLSINKTINMGAFLSLLLLIISCGGSDPAPTEQEVVTEALVSGTWKVQSVTVDGADQSSIYTGLIINFTATGFSASNGSPVWPASASWSFTDDLAKTIIIDGLEISIVEASSVKLVLKLTWNKTTLGPGRVASLSGQNIFTFAH